MFIVTLDDVQYEVSGHILTSYSVKRAKAEAIGQAIGKGQRITKATKITVEWSEKPYVTPDP
jgi:hypothetical protein